MMIKNLKRSGEIRIEPPTNSPEGESKNPRNPLPPRGKTEGGSREAWVSTAAYPMRILRKHGLAPTDSASQRSEIATMLISRWLAAALGISAILTKTSYSKPFLITDFGYWSEKIRRSRLMRRTAQNALHLP